MEKDSSRIAATPEDAIVSYRPLTAFIRPATPKVIAVIICAAIQTIVTRVVTSLSISIRIRLNIPYTRDGSYMINITDTYETQPVIHVDPFASCLMNEDVCIRCI